MSEEIKDEIVDDVAGVIVEDTQVEAEVETPEAPLTEARTVSAIQASMAGMSKDGLDAIFEAAKKAEAKAKVEDDEEEEDDEGDEDEGEMEGKMHASKNHKAKKESKKSSKDEQLDGEKDLEGKSPAKKKKVKADDGTTGDVVEKKFKEDVEALVKDEDTLSEGLKAKAETIFEAALSSKIIAETAKLEERYASDLAGEVEAIKEDLVDKVDGYLTYVVENWMKDNEVAIEHSLKSEITESFIDSLGQLFAEHHINVPSDKGDILDALSEEAKDAKAQLNDATANAMDLAEKVKAFERKDIVAEACKGLAATEEAKVKELIEGIEADDNESYAAKVATIKESYLNKDTTVEATPEVDAITEDKLHTQETDVSDNMKRYLSAIERTK